MVSFTQTNFVDTKVDDPSIQLQPIIVVALVIAPALTSTQVQTMISSSIQTHPQQQSFEIT